MRLIKDGPDVPDSLIEAHSDGGVVFFCGAGISYPAGLAAIWNLIADQKATSDSQSNFGLFELFNSVESRGWTPSLKRKFVVLLRPVVSLRATRGFSADSEELGSDDVGRLGERVSSLVSWDVSVGAGEAARDYLANLKSRPDWPSLSTTLLSDFTDLVVEAMELMQSLGGASATSDPSHYDRPSIAEHEQNHEYHQWTVLLTLLRESWENALTGDLERARYEYARWKTLPYPVFRRLVLHAATFPKAVRLASARDLLLESDARWLWSVDTQREVFRLLDSIAKRGSVEFVAPLWDAILKGPPRANFAPGLSRSSFLQATNRGVWLLLRKFEAFGAVAPPRAKRRAKAISNAYPNWALADDDRDEFSVWTGSIGGNRSGPGLVPLPSEKNALARELAKRERQFDDYGDAGWRALCQKDPGLAIDALLVSAQRAKWPTTAWRTALQVFADKAFPEDSWSRLSTPILESSERAFSDLLVPIAWWVKVVASGQTQSLERTALGLIERVLNAKHASPREPLKDVVSAAINHPVGHVTQALVNLWFEKKPGVGAELPAGYVKLFNLIATRKQPVFRLGRTLLAAQLGSLYVVAPKWTKRQLLPKFRWSSGLREARAAWLGYLWTPRISKELLVDFKPAFIDAAKRYALLSPSQQTYAELLTVAALELADSFSGNELTGALNHLPREALPHCLRMVARSLGGAGPEKTAYWTNRAKPFIEKYWPKTKAKRSEQESIAFAQICIAANDALPEAVETVRNYLTAGRSPDFVVNQFAGLERRFPSQAISLVATITDTRARGVYPLPTFRAFLDACIAAEPGLVNNISYRALDEFLQANGR